MSDQRPTPETDKEFDFVRALAVAQARVEQSPLFERFIDGTPLANDIAVWIASAYCEGADHARKLERERDEAREKLSDWENAALHVESDHPNEVHCGCVPILRKLLADARKDADEWQSLHASIFTEAETLRGTLREIAAADWKTSGELRGMARKALEGVK